MTTQLNGTEFVTQTPRNTAQAQTRYGIAARRDSRRNRRAARAL